MKLGLVFALTVLGHMAFTGSRVTAALHWRRRVIE